MQALWMQFRNLVWNIFNRPGFSDLVDILIVAFLLYELIMLTRETRASAVIKGLVILFAASIASSFFGLTALNWLLTMIVNNGAIVLVILFQPELRKALERMGQGTFRSSANAMDMEQSDLIVNEITECLLTLSRRRVGALIVFERQIGLKDVVETGTTLNSQISAALLENIFEPNTPLHDGAVIIRGTRIMAAACILTLTERNSISKELGTRHRAGLGVTETTDAITLIVSEETGTISVAQDGHLTRPLDKAAIESILRTIYQPRQKKSFTDFFTKRLHGKDEHK